MDNHYDIILKYINKNEFISPEFQDVGFSYFEIVKACEELVNKQIIKKRDCVGLAYELV